MLYIHQLIVNYYIHRPTGNHVLADVCEQAVFSLKRECYPDLGQGRLRI